MSYKVFYFLSRQLVYTLPGRIFGVCVWLGLIIPAIIGLTKLKADFQIEFFFNSDSYLGVAFGLTFLHFGPNPGTLNLSKK